MSAIGLGTTACTDSVKTQPPLVSTEGIITPVIMEEDTTVDLMSIQDLYDDGVIVDVDTAFENLTFTLTVDNENVTLEWYGTASSNPTVSPAADYFGTATITLCVSDGEYETCEDNDLTVNEVIE